MGRRCGTAVMTLDELCVFIQWTHCNALDPDGARHSPQRTCNGRRSDTREGQLQCVWAHARSSNAKVEFQPITRRCVSA